MRWLQEAVRELERVFRRTPDKRAAHRASRPLLEQFSREPLFVRDVLEHFFRTPGALERRNYPVVGIDLALNAHFGLVANCWIPMPGGATHITTKAVHHHGDMLLSTATIFGPGYEHWMFSHPRCVDPVKELFTTNLIERALHPKHNVSFVDAGVAHVPMFPADLTITLALWSSRHATSWREHIKRLPIFMGREDQLRKLAVRLGMRRALDLKVVEYFDFYPTDAGFKGMRNREEFERGPTEDHVYSCFHVVQATGNANLAPLIQKSLGQIGLREAHSTVNALLDDLRRDVPIRGRLSEWHYSLAHANFTNEDMERALAVLQAKESSWPPIACPVEP